MSATQSRTGRAGNITVSSAVVPITGWTATANVEFADATDSGNFDSGSGNLYKSQLSGDTQIEATIKGYWDAATTGTDITGKLKNPTGGPWAVVLKIDASTTYVSGNFDFKSVETTLTVPGATMVEFTANIVSNGTYTLS